MVDSVRKFVHKCVNENKITTSQIVILTTGKVEYSPVFKAKKLGNISLVPLEQQPGTNEVRFSTLHRFKGLEADVVVVCDVKPSAENSMPKHLYVATSRARHLLAIYSYEG
jgi:DNA helicase IV